MGKSVEHPPNIKNIQHSLEVLTKHVESRLQRQSSATDRLDWADSPRKENNGKATLIKFFHPRNAGKGKETAGKRNV